MKSWNSWLLSLGFAGWCLACVGCGGGDVPDPDADSNAAAEPAPAEGANPAPAPAPAPAAVAKNEDGPPAGSSGMASAPGGQAAERGGSAKARRGEEGKADEAAKKEEEPPVVAEGSASAAQMLALGNRPLPVAEQPAGAAGAPSTPGTSGAASAPGVPGGDTPGYRDTNAPSETEQMYAAQRAEMAKRQAYEANSGGTAGGVVGPGNPSPSAYGENAGSGAAGEGGPADFKTPFGAVQAFLAALKAKNPEKLAEATARRAATEAKSAKNQKLFSSILEQSLTEDDLTELANKLEGFNIVGNNQPKSSGQFGVILGKNTESGDYHSRTVTARREKDGWKVMDISGLGVIDRPTMKRATGRSTRSGR